MASGQHVSASSPNSGSIKAWLKALMHSKNDRDVQDPPAASLSPPASSDMISFHHTMDDEEDRPSFLPPPRSFSGGSGPTSYASASRRTLSQPIATPTLSRSRSTEVFNAASSHATPYTPSPGSSPSKSPGTNKMLSQGLSSLSSLIKHERRASSNYRQMRSGSALNLSQDTAAEPTSSCKSVHVSSDKDIPTRTKAPESLKVGLNPDQDLRNATRPSLTSKRGSSFTGGDVDESELLLPEGEMMLKVTHKKVKTRTFRLDADRGQILWESKRNTIVNLESIREVRFGPSAASYRTSLNISSAHEPRWITIIYQNAGIYKALHLIALSDASLARWRSSLLHLQTLRRELTGAVGASSSLEHRRVLWMRHHWKDADQSNDEKLSVDEVMKLCRRLGIESNKTHLRKCFNVADYRNRGYLDFEDFQYFVSLLKRRADVQLIFDAWAESSDSTSTNAATSSANATATGITEDRFKQFIHLEQGNTTFKDDQIHDLFVRHCNSRLSHSETKGDKLLMDYDGFLDFLASSDNPPLLDQLPLFSTIAADTNEDQLGEESAAASKPLNLEELKDIVSSQQMGQNAPSSQQKMPSRAFADTAEELIAAGPSSSHATTHKVAAHLRKSTVQHDMKRPLSEYYISSSHNTYLVGGQWKGNSTVEGYIRALLQGARSVELDCWDGPNMTPQITHGRTLTSRVAFQDVISAIARYAFVTSPYPLILSLEVHADPPQQDVMARILIDTLGEMLLMQPLGDAELKPSQDDNLPSPEDLRFKVLVKAKNVLIPEKDVPSTGDPSDVFAFPKNEVVQAVIENPTSTSATETSTTDSEMDANLGAKGLMRRVTRRSKSAKAVSAESGRAQVEVGHKETKKLMSTALASLLIYTVGVKCRGFNKKESYATQHMISLSEKSAMKFIHDLTAREALVKHNRTHLTRVYPSMMSFARLHASRNFVPLDMWAAGCQLVALNWQTTDMGFEVNQAMFSRNGRCGYVLKPIGLRTKEQMKTNNEKMLRFSLDLQIISAQQLPKKKSDIGKEKDSDAKEPIDPFVAVSLIAPTSWGRQPRGLMRQPGNAKFDVLQQNKGIAKGDGLQKQLDESINADQDFLRQRVISDSSAPSDTNVDRSDMPTNEDGHLVERSQLRTPTIKGNGFSPQWNTSMSVQIDVPAGMNSSLDVAAAGKASKAELEELSRGLLDLCFVRFEIYDDDLQGGTNADQQVPMPSSPPQPSDKKVTSSDEPQAFPALAKTPSPSGASASQINSTVGTNASSVASSASSTSSLEADCVAAFAVSIGALQQGYRHLPLYDHQLSQYLFSTLFIHSRLRFVRVVSKPSKQ